MIRLRIINSKFLSEIENLHYEILKILKENEINEINFKRKKIYLSNSPEEIKFEIKEYLNYLLKFPNIEKCECVLNFFGINKISKKILNNNDIQIFDLR